MTGYTGPIDKVQIFEAVIEDATTLQQLVDSGHKLEDVNVLSRDLNLLPLLGEPVSIIGGEVEAVHVDAKLHGMEMFAVNDEGIKGIYRGMAWRKGTLEIMPYNYLEVLRICHKVDVGKYSYDDVEGNTVSTQYRKFITVEGAIPTLLAEIDSHDYRKLADDGFSLDMDKIAIDDTMSLQEKADIIARMFFVKNVGTMRPDEKETRRQRLSYLNTLGIFKDARVSSPYWIKRKDEDIAIIPTGGGKKSYLNTQYVSTDQAIIDGGLAFNEFQSVISFEYQHPDVGNLSIPFAPGDTSVE